MITMSKVMITDFDKRQIKLAEEISRFPDRYWIDTRIDPPTNRRNSFLSIATKRGKRK